MLSGLIAYRHPQKNLLENQGSARYERRSGESFLRLYNSRRRIECYMLFPFRRYLLFGSNAKHSLGSTVLTVVEAVNAMAYKHESIMCYSSTSGVSFPFKYRAPPSLAFNSFFPSFTSSCPAYLSTMGKSDAEVIALFNEQVNMTADELESWLDDPQSRKAGTGVGIESGRRIIEILRKNPTKKPDAYDKVRPTKHFFFFCSSTE